MANTPNLTFPKRVGGPAVKADVADLINRTIETLAPQVDFSQWTLEVHFTNDRNAGAAHFSAKVKETSRTQQGSRVELEGVSTLEASASGAHPHIRINLQGVKAADYDGLKPYTANHIIHEVIHYIQYAMGALEDRTSQTFIGRTVLRNDLTTWNHGPAMALSHAIRKAAGRAIMSEPLTSDESTTYGSSTPYHRQPWERQAWRGAHVLMRSFGFERCYRTVQAYEGFKARGAPRVARKDRPWMKA
jgi:hypothetical protein